MTPPEPTMHCRYFAADQCRSCEWLDRSYAEQIQAKQRVLSEQLPMIPQQAWLLPAASAQSGFRNKAKMAVGGRAGQLSFGLLDQNRAADLSHCPLYPEALRACFEPIRSWLQGLGITPYDLATRRGELKFLILTTAPDGLSMLRLVLRSRADLDRLRKHLPLLQQQCPALRVVSVNIQPLPAAIVEGADEYLISTDSTLLMQVNDINLYLRPQSFFQTNTAVAAELYQQARAWVREIAPRRVLDAYCGVGGFALHCAGLVSEVFGIERSAEAIASAQWSARELCGRHRGDRAFTRIEFAAGDVAPEQFLVMGSHDVVIVNPPRRGLDASLRQSLRSSPVGHLIYSSCHASTLARDLDEINGSTGASKSHGFEVVQARCFDMFPHTAHVEVAVLLRRRSLAHGRAHD